MIVLDTHAWVWWVNDPQELSPAANRAIDTAREENAIYVSSISAWEVALLVAKGRLQLTMDVEDWIARSEALPFLNFIPVDNRIAVRSTTLPGTLHSDPADRIIIAAALTLGAPIVTKDEKIKRYRHVKTVW